MAILYITEFPGLANAYGPQPILAEPENASQTVAIAAGSAQSAAFAPNTSFVQVATDAICSIKFGTNPTAAATNRRMAAGESRIYAVPQGQSYKVAVITNT